jgi:hypothetical protein
VIELGYAIHDGGIKHQLRDDNMAAALPRFWACWCRLQAPQ